MASSTEPSHNRPSEFTAGDTVAQTELRAGALGLAGILAQAVTNIAPAIAVFFTVSFTASNAGIATPAAYAGAFVLSLTTAVVLAQLARHLPSAGTYYTYVSRGLHPRAGFLVAWVYFLFAPVVTAQVGTSMGTTLETILRSEYDITFPWWLFTALLIVFVGYAVYRGIELSAKLLIALGLVEIVIVGALSVWGFFDSGDGGVSLRALNPASADSGNGFYLGIVFAIFALTGWDAAAPVAEESADPRRNIPRGVLGAVIFMGFFLIVCSWGLLSGWGINDAKGFAGSSDPVWFVLAKQFWGPLWWLALIALINSALAVVISAANVATRLWYAMARSGALPQSIAVLHPIYKTPVNAVYLQTVVSIVIGLGAGLLIGADKVYNLTGLMFTFVLIFVYVCGNIAAFRLYRTEYKHEFNPLLHVVIPAVSSIGLIFVGYNSLNPAPAAPNNWAFPLVLIWMALGALVLVAMRMRGREEWLLKAGQAAIDVPLSDQPKRDEA